jgi:hypothetical protein
VHGGEGVDARARARHVDGEIGRHHPPEDAPPRAGTRASREEERGRPPEEGHGQPE